MRATSLLLAVVYCAAALFYPTEVSAHPLRRPSGAGAAESAPSGPDSSTAVEIKHFDPAYMNRELREYDTAVVFYYVDYCPICTKLRPVFAKASHLLDQQILAEALNGGIATRRILAAVNCGLHPQGCISSGVSRVPVFKRFRNGGRTSEVLRYRLVNSAILLEAVNSSA